jgi:D-alanyl-D-alanine carboxypeptidase (penicillin-binding protein 5/6)
MTVLASSVNIRRKGLSFNVRWLSLFIPFYLAAEPLKFDIKGDSAILMNAQSGAILFEYQSTVPRYPASTTKVATALYVLKHNGDQLGMPIQAEPESLVTVSHKAKRESHYTLPAYWQEPDGTHIGIKKGEILSLLDLLKGLLICSGNDAANVIAHKLGPTIPIFLEGLNSYVRSIGCLNTTFKNPHGLHDPNHQTTAYDLALITREALKYPIFCDIVLQMRFIRPKTNKQAAMTLLQNNRLIRPGKFYYSKAIGVKTGYHEKAKKTLIAAARTGERTLIAVLLGYADKNAVFEDAVKLFEAAFNQPKVQRVLLKAGPQSFKLDLPKADRSVQTYLPEDLSLEYYPAEDPSVKCFLHWQNLSLPILKDQQVAELKLLSKDGMILKTVSLLSTEDVQLAWPHRWLLYLFSRPWLWIVGGGILILAFVRMIKK